MAEHPKDMDRLQILEKVLSINPHLRQGDVSTQEMSDQLVASVKATKRSRTFSDDKFVAVLRGMLTDLEASLNEQFRPFVTRQTSIDNKVQQQHDTMCTRLVEFFAGANPGPLSESAKALLREQNALLESLGLSINTLDRLVRTRSVDF